LKQWESVGLHPADFWASTPRRMIASLRARETYLIRQQNLAMTQAYYTAALSRWNGKKPFPKLQSLLVDVDKPRRARTVDEQWQLLLSIVPTRASVN
jgi:hypothetical protein